MARQARGKGSAVHAGEFDLTTDLLPERVLEIITTTYGTRVHFLVREGLPWWEVARLAAEARLCRAEDFGPAMTDPALLAKYAIPSQSAEGFLFPDTYAFVRSQVHNASSVVEAMLARFNRQAREVWPDFQPGGPPDPAEVRRVVILASIVARETGNATEPICNNTSATMKNTRMFIPSAFAVVFAPCVKKRRAVARLRRIHTDIFGMIVTFPCLPSIVPRTTAPDRNRESLRRCRQ